MHSVGNKETHKVNLDPSDESRYFFGILKEAFS